MVHPCGVEVMTVPLGGAPLLLDRTPSLDGTIHTTQIAGRWLYTEADITSTAAPGPSYHPHTCPATTQAAMRRAADRTDTAGPCARCQRPIPHRYGPLGQPLCATCEGAR